MTNKELELMACDVREGIIEGVFNAKSGHPGGSLSAADMYTYLFFEEMNIDPAEPRFPGRDRFVLSKGHTAPGYYSALAHRGFFPVEDLKTLRKLGSYLQGHPCMNETPGVDMSSGSLGQGLSAACGMIAVFAGATNCPIASLMIAMEMFRGKGLPFFAVTVALSFVLSGCYSLYGSQRFAFSKTGHD